MAGQPASYDQGWYTVPVPSNPRTIAITGANSGIGFAAAGKLAAAGHDVHLICRSMEKAQKACADVEVRLNSSPYAIPSLIEVHVGLPQAFTHFN
jgi:NAD(P)-dependent dehydrogenase (short-subunit alcohol dehydrogenase family)